ncbi:MAG: hypothetical protein ACL93V_06030 [Candidatus Electrothrix sp. YB6]
MKHIQPILFSCSVMLLCLYTCSAAWAGNNIEFLDKELIQKLNTEQDCRQFFRGITFTDKSAR